MNKVFIYLPPITIRAAPRRRELRGVNTRRQAMLIKLRSLVEGVRSAHPKKFNTGLLIECDNEEEIETIRKDRPNNITVLIYKAGP